MSEPDTVQVDRKFYRDLLMQLAYAHEQLREYCSCPFCAQARALEKRAA